MRPMSDDAGGLRLRDHANLPENDDPEPDWEGEPEPVFCDVSPGADDSVYPSSDPPQRASAPTEPLLPQRRFATPPKPEVPDAGYARCPACSAKNPHDALRCALCAAELPRPEPQAPLSHFLLPRQAPAAPPEGDPDLASLAEVLPAHVIEEIARRRQRREEQVAAGLDREARRRRKIVGGSAAGFVLGGVVYSGPALGFVVLDAALGILVSSGVIRTGGGPLRGALQFGVAALFAIGCRGPDAAMGVGAFLASVGLASLALSAGWILGDREVTGDVA